MCHGQLSCPTLICASESVTNQSTDMFSQLKISHPPFYCAKLLHFWHNFFHITKFGGASIPSVKSLNFIQYFVFKAPLIKTIFQRMPPNFFCRTEGWKEINYRHLVWVNYTFQSCSSACWNINLAWWDVVFLMYLMVCKGYIPRKSIPRKSQCQ